MIQLTVVDAKWDYLLNIFEVTRFDISESIFMNLDASVNIINRIITILYLILNFTASFSTEYLLMKYVFKEI